MTTYFLAALHLVTLVLGVTSLVRRGEAMKRVVATRDENGIEEVFVWDNVYGVVSVLWIGSGVFRAFGGFEKGSDYYLSNHVFWLKMTFLAVILAAETFVAVRLALLRIRRKKKVPLDLAPLPRLVRLHTLELWMIAGMVVAATLLARGVGVVKPKDRSTNATSASGSREIERGADLERGAELYRAHCVSCHQPDGRGMNGRLAADFVGDPTRLGKTDAELLARIENGVPGTAMLGFGGRLGPDDRKAVLAHLRHSFGTR